jgi:hypothetical protein
MKHSLEWALVKPAVAALLVAAHACAAAQQSVPAPEPVGTDTTAIAARTGDAGTGADAGVSNGAGHGATLFGRGVDSARLASQRGGSDLVSTEARLNGTVGSNAANNVATGSNSIDAGSFANATGLPVVIQNTGANVLIQNATVINLQLK